MHCSSCGKEVDAGKFCVYCGAVLSKEDKRICPSCGAQNAPNNNFCSECGLKLKLEYNFDILFSENGDVLLENLEKSVINKVQIQINDYPSMINNWLEEKDSLLEHAVSHKDINLCVNGITRISELYKEMLQIEFASEQDFLCHPHKYLIDATRLTIKALCCYAEGLYYARPSCEADTQMWIDRIDRSTRFLLKVLKEAKKEGINRGLILK